MAHLKLIDFWNCLPGEWHFERDITNGLHQVGTINVVKKNVTEYFVCEKGSYIYDTSQTFFRNYKFFLIDHVLHIHGQNPKDGFVHLYEIKENSYSYKHHCGNDIYLFELIQFSKCEWEYAVTISGPQKNLKIITYCKQVKI